MQSAPRPRDRKNPSSTSMTLAPFRSSAPAASEDSLARHTANRAPADRSLGVASNLNGSDPLHSKGATWLCFQKAKPNPPATSRLESISSRQKPQSSMASRALMGSPVNGFSNSELESSSSSS